MPATFTRPRLLATLAALATGLLTGCANGPLRVNTDVQSFAWPMAPAAPTPATGQPANKAGASATAPAQPIQWQGARYRFDVLPSQAHRDLAPLHAMAQAALGRHGLVLDDAQPRFAVQVDARLHTAWVDDWGHPWAGYYGPHPAWHLGLGVGRGSGWGWGVGWRTRLPASTYLRELRIAIVELKTGQTLYESRARNESPSGQHDAIFATMVNAALQGFPNASPGWHRVTTDLPPAEPQPAVAPQAATPSSPDTPQGKP